MPNYRTMRRVQEWEHPPSKPVNKDGTKAKPWTVVLWEDGSYSCNCPSWCKTPETAGVRACKHIARVLLDARMRSAFAVARSQPPLVSVKLQPVAVKAVKKNEQHSPQTTPSPMLVEQPGKRRIILED